MVEQFANNASTTLSSGIDNVTTSVTLVDGSKFSSSGNYRIVIDSELMLVTARSTNTLTVVRGQEGTSAVSHSSGATVAQIITAAAIAQLKVDTKTILTITSTKTSTYTIQTTDEIIACNTSGGSFNIFLPTSPTVGERHTILDVGGQTLSNPLTISGNGTNIVTTRASLASSDTITTNYGSNTYMFNGTFWSLL